MLDPLLWLVVLAVYGLCQKARLGARIGACVLVAAALWLVIYEVRWSGRMPAPFWTVPLGAVLSGLQGGIIALVAAGIGRLMRRRPVD